MKHKRHVLILGLLYISLPLFLVLSDPKRLPLPMLWLPFVLLFLIIFTSTRLIMRKRVTGRRLNTIAVVGAAIPVLLLILASIDQLTIRDMVIAIGLIIGTVWYLNRLDI